MDVQWKGILTLIRCGMTGQPGVLPDGFDLDQAYSQLRRHQILALGYLGAVQCGVDKQQDTMRKLFQDYCRCLQHSENQMKAVQRVCEAFDEAGIDYMPLKGCNVKALYPSPELRIMGDADILIRTEQYGKIRPIMQALGFEESLESDHELNWHNAALLLELHKRIIPSYNRDYYRYFGDGWRLATIQQGCRFAMKCEDEFIYLFTHFAKHYRDGGIGIRHLIDLHVYLETSSGMDMVYIARELSKLQLNMFYENVCKTIKACFCGGEWDDMTHFIACHIFRSGAYGTEAAKRAAAVVRQASQTGVSISTARFSRLFSVVFLPLQAMQIKHPLLKRAPVLLPVFWGGRAVSILLSKRGDISGVIKRFKDTSEEESNLYQQALNYVGLDFDFKE